MKYTINDIATVISESIPNPSESGYEIFVGLEHYDSGEVKVSRYGSTANLVTAVKLFKKGDILLARRNVYLKRAGLVDFDGVTSGDSIVLRVKEDLSNLGLSSVDVQKYLPFVLNTEEFWNYAEKYSDGTMSKRLSPKTLLQYEFEIPENISEKNDLLWAAFEAKESYRKMIAATDEMVKSQFISQFGNDSIPKVELSSLCTEFLDGDWIESKDQSDSGYRLVQTGNVGIGEYIDKSGKARFVSEDTFKRLNCTEVFAGDILFSRLPEPLGRCCILPENFQKAITAVDCAIARLGDKCLPEFLVTYTSTELYTAQVNKCMTGTTRQRISRNNLAKILVPCPDLTAQKSFVRVARQADKSKFELKQAIEKIDKVMRALMQ